MVILKILKIEFKIVMLVVSNYLLAGLLCQGTWKYESYDLLASNNIILKEDYFPAEEIDGGVSNNENVSDLSQLFIQQQQQQQYELYGPYNEAEYDLNVKDAIYANIGTFMDKNSTELSPNFLVTKQPYNDTELKVFQVNQFQNDNVLSAEQSLENGDYEEIDFLPPNVENYKQITINCDINIISYSTAEHENCNKFYPVPERENNDKVYSKTEVEKNNINYYFIPELENNNPVSKLEDSEVDYDLPREQAQGDNIDLLDLVKSPNFDWWVENIRKSPPPPPPNVPFIDIPTWSVDDMVKLGLFMKSSSPSDTQSENGYYVYYDEVLDKYGSPIFEDISVEEYGQNGQNSNSNDCENEQPESESDDLDSFTYQGHTILENKDNQGQVLEFQQDVSSIPTSLQNGEVPTIALQALSPSLVSSPDNYYPNYDMPSNGSFKNSTKDFSTDLVINVQQSVQLQNRTLWSHITQLEIDSDKLLSIGPNIEAIVSSGSSLELQQPIDLQATPPPLPLPPVLAVPLAPTPTLQERYHNQETPINIHDSKPMGSPLPITSPSNQESTTNKLKALSVKNEYIYASSFLPTFATPTISPLALPLVASPLPSLSQTLQDGNWASKILSPQFTVSTPPVNPISLQAPILLPNSPPPPPSPPSPPLPLPLTSQVGFVSCRHQNALEVIASTPSLRNFRLAIYYGKAEEYFLDNYESITIFAPENDAFFKLNRQYQQQLFPFQTLGSNTTEVSGLLGTIVGYHIVPNYKLSNDMLQGLRNETLTTENGISTLNLQSSGQEIWLKGVGNEAAFLEWDLVNSCNVAIHIIDTVLLPFQFQVKQEPEGLREMSSTSSSPPSLSPPQTVGGIPPPTLYPALFTDPLQNSPTCIPLSLVLQQQEELSLFSWLFQHSGLSERIADENGLTVFAPSDVAISEMMEGIKRAGGISQSAMQLTLAYHIVQGEWYEAALVNNTALITIASDKQKNEAFQLDVFRFQNNIEIKGLSNQVGVIEVDLLSCGAVVHVVDGVLLPVAT